MTRVLTHEPQAARDLAAVRPDDQPACVTSCVRRLARATRCALGLALLALGAACGQASSTAGEPDGIHATDPATALLARRQVEAIAAAFTRKFPQHTTEFATGMRALASALEALDARWTSLAPRLRTCRVLASQPAYDHVARRYDFAIVNVLLDPEAAWDESTAKSVADALAHSADADAEPRADESADTPRAAPHTAPTLLFWETAPPAEVAEALRARFGITSVVVTPAENPSPAEIGAGRDSLALLAENLDRLEATLRDR